MATDLWLILPDRNDGMLLCDIAPEGALLSKSICRLQPTHVCTLLQAANTLLSHLLLSWLQPTHPLREHSGNIQGTFMEHAYLTHPQGTFREHSGNIQGTFREHSGNV
jgi:hypothetical protein